jgi:hypothetical protein
MGDGEGSRQADLPVYQFNDTLDAGCAIGAPRVLVA